MCGIEGGVCCAVRQGHGHSGLAVCSRRECSVLLGRLGASRRCSRSFMPEYFSYYVSALARYTAP
jgi:hypothetical protein